MTFGIIIKNPQKPTHNRALGRTDMKALCVDKNSAVSKMVNDRVMYRHIRDGNASDPSLKRDAEHLARQEASQKKMEFRENRKLKIAEKVNEYKKKYGGSPFEY